MNLIDLSSFKKARIILGVNSFLLFLFIIFTPYLVKAGTWGLTESAVEGLFLALEIIILIKLFKDYDFYSNKSERKANRLSDKLKEQQKLLSDSLEYLGKMNVQMSIVKQMINKLKSPVGKNRLEYVMNEMLQVAGGLVGSKGIILKIIDLKNEKTIKKFSLGEKGSFKGSVKNITNRMLCKNNWDKKNEEIFVVASSYDNFSLSTFAIFNVAEVTEKDKEEENILELVQDIINQCEVMFLLFNSKYYKQ